MIFDKFDLVESLRLAHKITAPYTGPFDGKRVLEVASEGRLLAEALIRIEPWLRTIVPFELPKEFK